MRRVCGVLILGVVFGIGYFLYWSSVGVFNPKGIE